MRIFLLILALTLLPVYAAGSSGAPPPVEVRHQISGSRFQYQVDDDDSARSIAARFGEPDTMILLEGGEPQPGSTITVDNRHIPAAAISDGVVINVPQRMLFVFRGGAVIAAWPVTVGRPDWPTPLGDFYVASRRTNPTWHVPPAIQDEMEEEGMKVVDEVKPGPDNPLGQSWVGLDHGGIGIHGTNHRRSIYLFASHGCVRLSPEAGTKLLKMVGPNEQVLIVYQPVALAILDDGRIFLESDADPYGIGHPHIEDVRRAARAAGVEERIDWQRASRVLALVEGVARRIDHGRKVQS